MAQLILTPDQLQLRLTPVEKLLGLLRDVDIPLAAVTAVEVVPQGIRGVRGLRAPGLGLPGIRLIGTWRRRGWKSLVSVIRNQPAVRLTLAGAAYDELLIGLDDAQEVARRLEDARRG